MENKTLDINCRAGSLTIVGTGIRGLSHMTREAISIIRHADKIFYLTNNPIIEANLININKQCYDLSLLYNKEKDRAITYSEMVVTMLKPVRSGLNIVAAFYGNPGVFATAPHLAIEVARSEGLKANMLPAISAVDCMVADLGIDPGERGCQLLEATYLMTHNFELNTSVDAIIFQPAYIGIYGAITESSTENQIAFFSYLIGIYGNDHPCIVYVAPISPDAVPLIVSKPLVYWLEFSLKQSIPAAATLYIQRVANPEINMQQIDRLNMKNYPEEEMRRRAFDRNYHIEELPLSQGRLPPSVFEQLEGYVERPSSMPEPLLEAQWWGRSLQNNNSN